MFRPSRRPHLAMTESDSWAIVERAQYGVLSMNGVEGYPYAVPMNHFIMDGALVFHAAVTGHRLEALRANPRACFTVTVGPEEATEAIPVGTLGTYASVLLFGEVSELPHEQHEKALDVLLRRLLPVRTGEAERFIQGGGKVSILRMEVAHISGRRLLVK